MTTLAEATLALSKILVNTVEGIATGGNATTLQDSGRSEPNDFFDKGTIWFLSGNNSGKTAVITDWTSPTFTFVTPGALCAASDRYAAAPADFPRYVLIQAINEALRSLALPSVNTALVTVAHQEAYTLPAGVVNVQRVEVARNINAPYYYANHYNWQEINGELRFDTNLEPAEAGYKIRLTYIPPATERTLDADVMPVVHTDRLAWSAAVYALRWRVQRTKDAEPDKLRLLNEAIVNAERMAARYPGLDYNKDPHLTRW